MGQGGDVRPWTSRVSERGNDWGWGSDWVARIGP